MLLSGIQAIPELAPRLKHSGVTPLGQVSSLSSDPPVSLLQGSSMVQWIVLQAGQKTQRRGARRSMRGGVLFLYVDPKSVERNDAYEVFSPA